MFTRGNRIYLRLKHVDGTWKNISTGLKDDEAGRKQAEKLQADMERQVTEQLAASNGTPLLTLTRYATEWSAKRSNVDAPAERAKIIKHVLPRIGHMLMSEIKPRHLDDLIEALKAEGKLAPRTIRSLSGLLHTMFKRAVKDEALVTNPVMMERGTLPKKVDKDPTWRAEAIYTRTEAEQMISDDRIPWDRRVLIALKFLAGGLRHGEAARLTWRNYDATTEPLGQLAIGKTKSGVPRQVPVHPTLAKILAAWKLSGWEATYGRAPTSDDLIVPTRNFTVRAASESQRQLKADLEIVGLRVRAGVRQFRRGHDFRRTFISLARADGAHDGPLRWVTHGPSASSMADLYSTFPWSALCAEVSKLRIDLREGKLLQLSEAG